MSTGCSMRLLISFTASSITVSVLRPRKSNLTRPASSTSSLANWVTSSPFCPLQSGTYSQSGFSPMTTPAACMPVDRVRPSSARANSMMVLKIGFDSWICWSFGSCCSAFSMVGGWPSISAGMLRVSSFTSANGRPITRATSLMALFADSVPKVMIWATFSLPYFPVT